MRNRIEIEGIENQAKPKKTKFCTHLTNIEIQRLRELLKLHESVTNQNKERERVTKNHNDSEFIDFNSSNIVVRYWILFSDDHKIDLDAESKCTADWTIKESNQTEQINTNRLLWFPSLANKL